MPLSLSIPAFAFILAAVTAGARAVPHQQASVLETARKAFEASQYAKAVQILENAASGDAQNAEIQFWLLRSHLELEENEKAVRSGERAIALAPQNSEYHHWLGKAYGEKADHANWFSALSLARKAHKGFETAVQLDGRNFAARQDLIEYLCRAPGIAGGSDERARAQIAELASMDAAEGHFAQGNCRRQKKDYPGADVEFAKALEASPNSADLIYDIGDYAMKRGQPDRLLAVADAGQKADPADPRGDFYRALAFILQREKPDEAERLLRAYLSRAPTRSTYPRPSAAHDWLGRLFEQQGNTAAAAAEYQAALELEPRDKTAHEALKRLRKNALSYSPYGHRHPPPYFSAQRKLGGATRLAGFASMLSFSRCPAVET